MFPVSENHAFTCTAEECHQTWKCETFSTRSGIQKISFLKRWEKYWTNWTNWTNWTKWMTHCVGSKRQLKATPVRTSYCNLTFESMVSFVCLLLLVLFVASVQFKLDWAPILVGIFLFLFILVYFVAFSWSIYRNCFRTFR